MFLKITFYAYFKIRYNNADSFRNLDLNHLRIAPINEILWALINVNIVNNLVYVMCNEFRLKLDENLFDFISE